MGESADLSTKIQLLEAELNRHDKNIENLNSMLQVCQLNDATTSVEIKQILEGISELKVSVAELKNKPAKRWDTIVVTSLTSLVSGIVGVVLGVFFHN